MATQQAFGFGTPFAAQIEHLRQKLNLPTQRWDDLIGRAHDKAFVVAGAAKADLLADLHTAVLTHATDGAGLNAFRKDFQAIVAKHGWTGWTGEGTTEGEAWRTRVIYQTNMATSYAAGRWAQMTDPEVVKLHPYWRYLHSDGALNPRQQHLAWHGLTLPWDHPFWKTHFAPNGYGCQCRITSVTRKEGEASARAGLGEPPAGWDAINTATGEQQGIGKGFGYAPGASLQEEMRHLVDAKAAKLPPALGQALRDDMLAMVNKPVFVEAKTAKAAEEWAVKNNLADFADYTGVKPEVANAWNKSLFEHLQEFPELRKNQQFTGTTQAQMAKWLPFARKQYADDLVLRGYSQKDADYWAAKKVLPKKVSGNTYATSWAQPGFKGVAVNSKFGKDIALFKQSLERDALSQHHPVGCNTIRSVVDHEMGHQLDHLLDLRIDKDIIQAYNEAKLAGMKHEVSGYADDDRKGKGLGEFIAECWAESCNNPTPRPFAARVSAIVRARYGSRFAP